MLGTWYLVLDTWYLKLGIWNLILDTWYLVFGTWYLILDTWYLIIGTLYLVLDTWYLICGTWYLVLDTSNLVLDTLYLVLCVCLQLLCIKKHGFSIRLCLSIFWICLMASQSTSNHLWRFPVNSPVVFLFPFPSRLPDHDLAGLSSIFTAHKLLELSLSR